MSLDRQNLTSFQSVRRILLSILTIFIVFKLVFSIIGTFDRPQIQGKFELYQTDLVLIASEWKPTADLEGLGALQTGIIGADILKSATQQYQNVRSSDETAIDNFNHSLADLASAESNANTKESLATQTNLINKTITAAKLEIDKIDLRIGILQAASNQPQQAIATWHNIITTSQQAGSKNIAASLIEIWNQPSGIDKNTSPQIAAEITTNFKGWFRDRVLTQLYTNLDDLTALAQLDSTVQIAGKDALIKLAFITVPRVLIGFGGVVLIVFFSVRIIILAIQQRAEKSLPQIILANIATPWTTPWDWEIVWQVFMVGFFFVGQFLLPTIFSALINPATLTTRGQGLYVFSSYVLMSGLGVGVLYLSIKSYFPLPPDWFKFNWKSNWLLWGIGGYLVANPIVIIVSLLNEKIWHGQGGSNPLLQIVLEGKDSTALWLFFGTAAVAAPLFEEFLFRGFLLPSLTRYVPVWASICISGLIFGVAHLSLSEILPLTSLGIILGIVYVRTRNLLAPMLLHSLWNSSTLASLFILGGS
ncbi:type II CAAX endopeptidase family protein [Chamaesiphon sp. GL140_3_metabinner_50]|uniref:CPBP family intramembrane glutamic endopeptidase n=1 Tax=Chamaesiphon sp. GL140_3_metabinner_50 TaxID=2970812 RepID=UPI0025FF5923|nr:type II CAAX endopeptidase family protein [Chamaesiphon sp. GL140_3_metabinner_50]